MRIAVDAPMPRRANTVSVKATIEPTILITGTSGFFNAWRK